MPGWNGIDFNLFLSFYILSILVQFYLLVKPGELIPVVRFLSILISCRNYMRRQTPCLPTSPKQLSFFFFLNLFFLFFWPLNFVEAESQKQKGLGTSHWTSEMYICIYITYFSKMASLPDNIFLLLITQKLYIRSGQKMENGKLFKKNNP